MHSFHTGQLSDVFFRHGACRLRQPDGPICDLPTPLNTLSRVVVLRSASVRSYTPVLLHASSTFTPLYHLLLLLLILLLLLLLVLHTANDEVRSKTFAISTKKSLFGGGEDERKMIIKIKHK